ncbi:MAG: pyridoxal phosphate-dependent aminotransferase family protein [Candidatus Methylacidiphilales bacterium]
MLKIPIFTEKRKPVAERCASDPNTKLRLRYEPYYHCVDRVEGIEVLVKGKRMVMMSSNEYLGLSQHPKVIEAADRANREWGTSSCGSRLANGTRRYHIELEEDLARFLGKEACHVLSAGYLSCMASVTSLAQRGDAVIVDRSIHAALWDGVNLSLGTVERFSHEDMDSLELLLEKLDAAQPKIIVVDGVYSMEGHIASLPRLTKLAEKYEAFLLVDDAHGFGVLGRDGRGVCDHFGLTNEVDLIAGSFSKSLASTGGFVAGDQTTMDYLRSSCRQIIFSAAISPGQAAAARASLQVMQDEPEHRERLLANTRYFQEILDHLGLDYWASPTPAIPIVIGNKEKCYFMWKSLWDQGFFTVMSISPGVPVGKDLIRTAVSALHTREHLDRFGQALAVAMKKAGVKSQV